MTKTKKSVQTSTKSIKAVFAEPVRRISSPSVPTFSDGLEIRRTQKLALTTNWTRLMELAPLRVAGKRDVSKRVAVKISRYPKLVEKSMICCTLQLNRATRVLNPRFDEPFSSDPDFLGHVSSCKN